MTTLASPSGMVLYKICVEGPKSHNETSLASKTMCNLYLSGFVDALFFSTIIQEERLRTCLPNQAEISSEQAVLIVQKYLSDHPEELNKSALELVIGALTTAFPCIKK
jgi:hypothetical protein